MSMVDGVQFVTEIGTLMMPELFAENLDCPGFVSDLIMGIFLYITYFAIPDPRMDPILYNFGEGNGPIHMANLHCTGGEDTLFDCPYDGAGSHTCGHSDDTSIKCAGKC